MSTGDWRLPSPQVGYPMSSQWWGPMLEAGSWFHAAVAARAVVGRSVDVAPNNDAVTAAAPAPVALSS